LVTPSGGPTYPKLGSKGEKSPFFIFYDIYKIKTMAKYKLSEAQLLKIKEKMSQEVVKEGKEGSYMAKQQLFIIATLAYEMWQNMEEGTQLDDWMESKIAQSEQSITAVVKSFMYGEIEDDMKGMSQLNFDEMVIGK
jgi:hypothetical protein